MDTVVLGISILFGFLTRLSESSVVKNYKYLFRFENFMIIYGGYGHGRPLSDMWVLDTGRRESFEEKQFFDYIVNQIFFIFRLPTSFYEMATYAWA